MHAAPSNSDRPTQPPPEEVREQLRRILESRDFSVRARRGEFLSYVVEETLAGRGASLKGVSIAQSVFDRDETFDQQTDPVVRLEARRLRSDLDSYYATAGRHDPVRISIPKGSYVPHFEWQQAPSPEVVAPSAATVDEQRSGKARQNRYLGIGAGAIAIFVIAAAAGWFLAVPEKQTPRVQTKTEDQLLALPKGPSIAVLPFLNLSSDDKENQYLSDGITEQLTMELIRFSNLWVIPLGAMQRYKEGLVDPRELRKEFGVDYVLEGSVRASGKRIRIAGRLVDAESAHYVWARSIEQPFTPSGIYDAQDKIAAEVAGNLAGEYGVLAQDSMRTSKRKAPESLDAYDCVLRYYDYQTTIDPARHAEVKTCLERAVALEPDYAEAWAVLSNIYMQEKRFLYSPDVEFGEAVRRAKSAVTRAVNLDPSDPTGHMMLSNLLFTEGDLQGFRRSGERALRLNPNSSDALAHYGLRLTLTGNWDLGLAYAKKAMTLNPIHPQWYRFAQVFYHIGQGEYELAIDGLNRLQMPKFFWTHLLRAATFGQMGRTEDARAAAEELLKLKPQFERDAARYLGAWQLSEPLRRSIFEGLEKAGFRISEARFEQAKPYGAG